MENITAAYTKICGSKFFSFDIIRNSQFSSKMSLEGASEVKDEVKIEDYSLIPELIHIEISNNEIKKEEIIKEEIKKEEDEDLFNSVGFSCPSTSTWCTQNPDIKSVHKQVQQNYLSINRQGYMADSEVCISSPGTQSAEIKDEEAEKLEITGQPSVNPEYSNSTKEMTISASHPQVNGTIEKPFKCFRCSYSASTRSILNRHLCIHSDAKPYKCPKCSYTACRKAYIVSHQRIHSSDRPYKCSKCSYSAKRKFTLLEHQWVHSNDKPHKCSECSFSGSTLKHLVRHQVIHTDEKPHKCSKCSYSTRKKSTLLRHQQTHLTEHENPFKCTECSFKTSNKLSLLHHRRTHRDLKPYKCSKCPFRASTFPLVVHHQQMHFREKPSNYKCSKCPYSTSQKSKLQIHQRIQAHGSSSKDFQEPRNNTPASSEGRLVPASSQTDVPQEPIFVKPATIADPSTCVNRLHDYVHPSSPSNYPQVVSFPTPLLHSKNVLWTSPIALSAPSSDNLLISHIYYPHFSKVNEFCNNLQ